MPPHYCRDDRYVRAVLGLPLTDPASDGVVRPVGLIEPAFFTASSVPDVTINPLSSHSAGSVARAFRFNVLACLDPADAFLACLSARIPVTVPQRPDPIRLIRHLRRIPWIPPRHASPFRTASHEVSCPSAHSSRAALSPDAKPWGRSRFGVEPCSTRLRRRRHRKAAPLRFFAAAFLLPPPVTRPCQALLGHHLRQKSRWSARVMRRGHVFHPTLRYPVDEPHHDRTGTCFHRFRQRSWDLECPAQYSSAAGSGV
jgi:hypothetical protein